MRAHHHLRSAIRRAGWLVSDAPRASAWTLVALVAAFVIAGATALAIEQLERFTPHDRAGTAAMVVYLGEAIDDAHAHKLTAELGQLAGVERAELVGPAESAARLQQALGADPTLLAGVELASLPASVEVTLAPGVRDVVALSPTVRALRGMPGVSDVVLEPATVDHSATALEDLRGTIELVLAMIGGLALLGALAVIRLRLDRGLGDGAVARLLGASPMFSILPTALAGAAYAALAAMMACGTLVAMLARYGDDLAATIAAVTSTVELAAPALGELALAVAFAAVLGAIGGGFAGASRATR